MSSPSEPPDLLKWLTSLGDPARLRLIWLLAKEELSVGEMARALQLPQSTVSRHLKVLLERGWITKRTVGTASLYQAQIAALPDQAQQLWRIAAGSLEGTHAADQDLLRLREVLAQRPSDSKAFFGRLGGEWDQLRQELFGQTFTAVALLGLVPADATIADLGCGTGNAAMMLAPFVQRLMAIDREEAMLVAARKRLAAHENVEFICSEIDDLPLDDQSVDAAICFLVLHHVTEPRRVIDQMCRIIKPGGTGIVVDMITHDRSSYRQSMGHIHLGFSSEQITQWSTTAGFTSTKWIPLRVDTGAMGPQLFAAVLQK